MILVTVGTQIPFDRLIGYVDEWSKETNYESKIIAQIGSSNYTSTTLEVFKSVDPIEFERYINECELIVSHAGMGSILTALRVQKPIVILPRKAELGEHRNDHQLATTRSFSDVHGVYVARTKSELFEHLSSKGKLSSGVLTSSKEYDKLLTNFKKLIL